MGCVFSKPQEDGQGVKRKGLLDQHSQFINNNEHQVIGNELWRL